jgi:RimJ/RimL family protein N-acetyltransferase
MPTDIDFMYQLATGERSGFRWTQRGSTPGPGEFAQVAWNGMLVQFIVEDRRSGERIGLANAYRPDFRHGFVSIGFILAPDARALGWPLEGVALLVDYLFRLWAFRKLYFEALEFNATDFESAIGRYVVEEGRLRMHEYYDGRYWDVCVLALYREAWNSARTRFVSAWSQEPDTPLVSNTANEFVNATSRRVGV